jgi:hypothetical protein
MTSPRAYLPAAFLIKSFLFLSLLVFLRIVRVPEAPAPF